MGEPAQSVFYRVTLDGFIPLGLWTKIEGLAFEHDVKEYREGGVNGYTRKIIGPVKYANLRLTRPVDADSMFISIWLASNLIKIIPQTMGITALNSEGSEITTWNLLGVVPVKWNGPTLDIMSNALATETLEIAYEQILGLGSVVGAAIGGAMTASASVSF